MQAVIDRWRTDKKLHEITVLHLSYKSYTYVNMALVRVFPKYVDKD